MTWVDRFPRLAPLCGKAWLHGERDCLDAIRGYYRQELGIPIRNLARPDKWWTDERLDLYRQLAEGEGFAEIDFSLREVRLHDVLLMSIGSKNPCHGAVYVGDGFVFHHFIEGWSRVDPYGGYLRSVTVGILRHRSLTVEPPTEVVDVTTLDPRGFADGRLGWAAAQAPGG